MAERISVADDSLFQSYAEHIQRYEFALEWCRGKRVLDAGCGTGYGSFFLAKHGARSVHGIDLSDTAIAEAKRQYRRDGLSFSLGDVERLPAYFKPAEFDVVVNFENIEHINNPLQLVRGAAVLADTFITSTPNGANTVFGANGKPANPFHVQEFALDELTAMVSTSFKSITVFGQFMTPTGHLRRIRSKEIFEQLCETYYNPVAKLGRLVKIAAGKRIVPPPKYNGEGDMYPGDFVIEPLQDGISSPSVLIAVCTNS